MDIQSPQKVQSILEPLGDNIVFEQTLVDSLVAGI